MRPVSSPTISPMMTAQATATPTWAQTGHAFGAVVSPITTTMIPSNQAPDVTGTHRPDLGMTRLRTSHWAQPIDSSAAVHPGTGGGRAGRRAPRRLYP